MLPSTAMDRTCFLLVTSAVQQRDIMSWHWQPSPLEDPHCHRRMQHCVVGTNYHFSRSAEATVPTTHNTVSSKDQPDKRGPKQRKRKDRRDSISDGQDKKFSRSSSDVFSNCASNSCDDEKSTEFVEAMRRCQSSSEVASNWQQQHHDDDVNSNGKVLKECAKNCKKHSSTSVDGAAAKKGCLFYVSDEDSLDDHAAPGRRSSDHHGHKSPDRHQHRRRYHGARPRKSRSDSLKENTTEEAATKETTAEESPTSISQVADSGLPWKLDTRDVEVTTISSPTSSSSALSSPCSATITSLMGSSSSSSDDEGTISPCRSFNDDEDDDLAAVKTWSCSPPVFDSQEQQPIAWQPHWVDGQLDANSDTRHFGMLNSRQHLDPSHLSKIPADPDHPDQRAKLKQLSRQLSSVRRKIEEFEMEFETVNDYKPSHSEKQSNKYIRGLMKEQTRLKRQIRLCRESGDSGVTLDDTSPIMSPASSSRAWSPTDFANTLAVHSDNSNDVVSEEDLEAMRNTLSDIERSLRTERTLQGRPHEIEKMTAEQLVSEKHSMQTALYQFQQMFGSKVRLEDRLVLKDLYERYRTVKRLVRRSSNVRLKDPAELETIPEGAEIPLTLASPPQRINIEMTNANHSSDGSKKEFPASLHEIVPKIVSADSSSTDGGASASASGGEENSNSRGVQSGEAHLHLHAMSRHELLMVQKGAREEKKQLRRTIKEKEERFQIENGKKLPKEEGKADHVYSKYRMTKAKLKLVDALLSKRKAN